MDNTADVRAARALARLLLGAVPERWAHTKAVAGHAGEIAEVVGPVDRDLLVCAAWLHDIGRAADLYPTGVYRTGLYPLDGATYLLDAGWPMRVAALVAHHGAARVIAEHLGLDAALAPFPFEEGSVSDALTYADMASGTAGQRMSLQQRLADIEREEAGPQPLPPPLVVARRRLLMAAVQRTEQRLLGLHRGHHTA